MAGEGGHQRQQRALGLVKVRQQGVHDSESIAGLDQEARGRALRQNVAGHAGSAADSSARTTVVPTATTAHREPAPPRFARPRPVDAKALLVHHVLGQVVDDHRPKRAEPDLQLQPPQLDAARAAPAPAARASGAGPRSAPPPSRCARRTPSGSARRRRRRPRVPGTAGSGPALPPPARPRPAAARSRPAAACRRRARSSTSHAACPRR